MSANLCESCGYANAKFHCAKCKSVYYCNTECQKSNWSQHKLKCTPPVAVQATEKATETETVIPTNVNNITSIINEIETESRKLERTIVLVDGMKATEIQIPINQIDASWGDRVVPKMLGYPIKYKRWRKNKVKPDREVAIFLLVEPVSGLAAPEWQKECGVLAFALKDTDFSSNLFWDIYSYIYHLMDYYGESDFNYERFKKSKLNAKSFHEYQDEEHGIQANFRANQRKHFAR
jgi:hypothetical protein